jgi:hypothetical protein
VVRRISGPTRSLVFIPDELAWGCNVVVFGSRLLTPLLCGLPVSAFCTLFAFYFGGGLGVPEHISAGSYLRSPRTTHQANRCMPPYSPETRE